eukprot:gene30416-37627_t
MSLVPYFVKRILPLLTTPVVVISANNDYTVPVNIDTRYDSKEVLRAFAPAWDAMVSHPMVVHWFVENRVELHPKVSTMPVGMNPKEGHPDDRSDHPSPDSLLPLDMKPLKMLQIDRIRNGTQWENRGQLTNHKEFVREVASYPFLLCVHGGGLDPSPKAWEAVLLGTIPIVESGPLDDAYRLLPVALVRNMTEFLQQDEEDVKEMMERWIDELGPHYVEGSKERSEALRRLTTRFWYDQIMSHYSLPEILVSHVEAVFNVVQFPGKKLNKKSTVLKHKTSALSAEVASSFEDSVTPALLNSFYDIRDNEGLSSMSQGVMESEVAYFSPNDLERFQKDYNLPVDAALYNEADTRVTTGELDEVSCTDSQICSKANIDVQYLMAVAQNTPTTFMYWNGADDWVEWLTAVADMESPPLVITIDHLQNEHDTAGSVIAAFNAQAMKLSLAGVTLVVPSGDDGVSGPDAREDVLKCGFCPQFPATSPYVTVVGATMGPESGTTEVACQNNKGGEITSGGGFSTFFAAPAYQADSMGGYCKQYCTVSPTALPTTAPTV